MFWFCSYFSAIVLGAFVDAVQHNGGGASKHSSNKAIHCCLTVAIEIGDTGHVCP